MYALNIDKETERILSSCVVLPNGNYDGMPIVEILPDGDVSDYLYLNGAYIYNPLPKPDNTLKAPHNIVAGECVTINGVMYKAIFNIPNGGYVIEGQNAVRTTIEAELLALQKGE